MERHRIEPVIELPDFPRPPCRSSCRAVIGAPFFATKIRFLAFQTSHWRAFFDTVITFCTVKTQPFRPMLPIINPFNIQRDSFNTPHSNILHTPHYKSLSTCEKICFLSAALAARSVLLTSSPNGFCVDLRDPWEKYYRAAWPIPHPTLHILNIPPPNLHCFSGRAPPCSQIRHSRAFM